MRWTLPWPRRAAAGPARHQNGTEIDIRVSRECIYRRHGGDPGPCPRCGSALRQSYQTYVIATRRGTRMDDNFIMGSDFGWFCARCPTVVIDPDDVSALLRYGLSGPAGGHDFALLGIVDEDAIPDEKSHLELGSDDNPIPLVRFHHYSSSAASGQVAPSPQSHRRKIAEQSRKKNRPKKKR